jgi:hypothetical protein
VGEDVLAVEPADGVVAGERTQRVEHRGLWPEQCDETVEIPCVDELDIAVGGPTGG